MPGLNGGCYDHAFFANRECRKTLERDLDTHFPHVLPIYRGRKATEAARPFKQDTFRARSPHSQRYWVGRFRETFADPKIAGAPEQGTSAPIEV